MLKITKKLSGKSRRLSRRDFMATGLEVGGGALGLCLPSMLQADEANGNGASGKSLIVFWTHGGMSQQDTYDMKPDAPSEYRGMYLPIGTSVPGITVSERFPEQARII